MPLADLDRAINYYRSLTFSSNTKRSYLTHLTAYASFCASIGKRPAPSDRLQVMRFIVHLTSKLQFSSLRQYINIIRLLCAEQNLPNPLQSWPVRALLQGIKRDTQRTPVRKLPVTPDLLLKIRHRLDLRLPADIVLWAAFTLAFFTLLRKSNVVPTAPSTFDGDKHPCRLTYSYPRLDLPSW